MRKVCQLYVKRERKRVDEGTMGFTDYVTHYEPMQDFADHLSDIANSIKGAKVKGIEYIHSQGEVEGAMVVYTVKDK